MKKYTTVAAAKAALAGHPGKACALCIIRCRMRTPPHETFFVISLSSIGTLCDIQRTCNIFSDIEFLSVAADLHTPPDAHKKTGALQKRAQEQAAAAEFGDPEGERAAAQRCLEILESGGTVEDAEAALDERATHPGWI